MPLVLSCAPPVGAITTHVERVPGLKSVESAQGLMIMQGDAEKTFLHVLTARVIILCIAKNARTDMGCIDEFLNALDCHCLGL